MKKIIALLPFFCLLSIGNYIFAAELETDSRIVEVTVYPDSALIGRQAELKLNAGEYKVIFPNIIPDVDEDSLRVSASDGAQVKLFGAQVKKEFLEEPPSEKVKSLKEEIQKTEDQIRRAQDLKELISEEKDFLGSIRLFSGEQIPKDLVTKMPPAKELDETLKFLDLRLKENYGAVMDAEIQARELEKKLDVLNRELEQVSGANRKLKRSIIVDLELSQPESFSLKVSYLVRGASWQPLYDARANFEKAQVELVSHGIVRQATGEDWQDVGMSLSTAKPAIGGRMPYVEPWFLRPYQPPLEEERFDNQMVMKARVQTMAFDAAERKVPEVTKDEQRYASVAEKGIAVVYQLAKKASIKSDGAEHKLPVSTQILNAKFEYSTYPRALLSAYLGSRVTNAEKLQLLAGRVNIFLDGEFVGTSSIDNIAPQEEFDLYLGADENVKVKREQVKKKVDETLIAGIPSPNRRETFDYKLTVENYKSKKVLVKLFEAMPVSENDQIKIKIDKVSIEPKEKDWKDRKGVWLWEMELEPKAKKEITYTYTVEHPRQMQVEGL
ncbi:MAG: mucoidy inhibitor MuiA family protein [Candidatus Omnitrophica bacterium]|nr:mucoidy inhibitor MuiA family protein [Candidatus Omnitrophota bacterium]